MRRTLTDKGVAALKPRPKRYAYPDPELGGMYIRVQPSGVKTYVAVAKAPGGRQIWTTVGPCDAMAIAFARIHAREILTRVRAGMSPIEAKADTVKDVANNWLKRHVRANGIRTAKAIEQKIANHILPVWADREFVSIRRSEVVKLLDDVEDSSGARTADSVLTVIQSIANWHASRVDNYASPIIRKMRRQSQKQQARARILDDVEIVTVWQAAETSGAFGAIIQTLLLTGQRLSKVADLKFSDVSIDGTWTIATAAREKGNAGVLVLPAIALEIIRKQPKVGPHVFTGPMGLRFRSFGKAKAVFDSKLPTDMPGWVLHDLRRTARSLMSRCGVQREIAERVLGHALTGVEGTYDRHEYITEKADALARLAGLIDGIVNQRSPNVLPMTKQRERK